MKGKYRKLPALLVIMLAFSLVLPGGSYAPGIGRLIPAYAAEDDGENTDKEAENGDIDAENGETGVAGDAAGNGEAGDADITGETDVTADNEEGSGSVDADTGTDVGDGSSTDTGTSDVNGEDTGVPEDGTESTDDTNADADTGTDAGTDAGDGSSEDTGTSDDNREDAGVPEDGTENTDDTNPDADDSQGEAVETGDDIGTGDDGSDTGKDSTTDDEKNTGSEKTEDEPAKKRPRPKLRKTSVILYPGWKDYEIFIDNLDEEAKVTYKSTKPKVASVSKDGVVTAVKKGKATIKVTVTDSDGNKKVLKLSVVVRNPYYRVTEATDIITSRGSFTFKLKRFGNEDQVTWSLVGSQYATITAVSDTDCMIEGIRPGRVTLTVSSGGREESFDIDVYEGDGAAFRITPRKTPYYESYEERSDYNENTRDYFVIRSYLERLAQLKGGLLVIAKGTYYITNTLCIPSDTTILIEDGATIVKTDYTGDPWLTATTSLFQTVAYNHTQTKFSKYNGEHDINIIGEGSATIDLNYVKSTAVVAAHCKNLTIKGITFRNLNSMHFIELDASKDVEISGNVFTDCIASPTLRKEAINIDTPDEETHGFNQGWTSFDQTPDKNVYITDNVFQNLETAIGTHKYSEGSYHTNIVISGNTFVNVTTYVVRMMNWKNSKVTDNYFILWERSETAEDVKAVILNGAVNPTVTGNRFVNFHTAISCAHWKNSGSGKIYAETYNKISKTNIRAMKKNAIEDCDNNYFEIYTVYGDKTDEYLETYRFTGL